MESQHCDEFSIILVINFGQSMEKEVGQSMERAQSSIS